MASILTNVGSMVALQTLRSTTANLETTQNRISTGMKVSTAKDNSSYWSIATTMKSDVSALKVLNENISLSAATVSTARVGVENINGLMTKINDQLTLATSASVDHDKIANEIDSLVAQVTSTIKASSYNGENLLDNVKTTTLVVSVKRDDTGVSAVTDSIKAQNLGASATPVAPTVTQQTTDPVTGVTTGTAAYTAGAGGTVTDFISGISAALKAGGTTVDRAAMAKAIQAEIDTQMDTVTAYAAELGAVGTRLELQQDFTSKLVDSLNTGIGALVDADLNEESARLQALQVQQQLGTQALSIANQAPQNILSLFR
ncbi:flagellin [Niveispirillum sp. SYP-B3756]|uniref:flagellin N-terminal helical domain-containing protein n=1 Tax=Niveispirillum sp. SYP-B3756 TaxID=2662178 RepID=UPI001291B80E|nr:flagellin [Niveispirillum sp. SYP-B3756]MQP67260.1 flagellin [Niveispirillum sp. SYP-B3756]